jgi:protoheme IX farnesyltransferase
MIDTTAWLLFALLVCWQMPHFYAIAIRKQREYRAAGLPVWPVVDGVAATRRHVIAYIAVLIGIVIALGAARVIGVVGAGIVVVCVVRWLVAALRPIRDDTESDWARTVFFQSLQVLLVTSAILVVQAWVVV